MKDEIYVYRIKQSYKAGKEVENTDSLVIYDNMAQVQQMLDSLSENKQMGVIDSYEIEYIKTSVLLRMNSHRIMELMDLQNFIKLINLLK